MLHQISVSDLRPGMFVSAMDCSWLNNPFWRSRFPVKDVADIKRLVSAGIERVTIDDTRGLGLSLPVADPVPPSSHAPEPPVVVERRAASRGRRSRQDEMARARETVERSKAAVARMFAEVRMGRAVNICDVTPVVDEITASIARDRSAMIGVTRLKDKNEYTYLHSIAVCALLVNLARQLGLPEDEVQQVGIGGLLHDIGKMTTPRALLEKPGALDTAERRIIEAHPAAGHRLLVEHGVGIGEIVLDICRHHHERIDGSGYPDGLSGEALSVHARMSAICDVYDAVTSQRPYKTPWSPADALRRMMAWEGHFDQRLLAAFVASIGIFPVDGLVRLHSNRLGIVLDGEGDGPTAPTVRVFYDVGEGGLIAPVDVPTRNSAGGDPIIRGEQGATWFGEDWPAMLDDLRAGRVAVPAL